MLSDTFEAENVRVITERLSLEARVDDPAIVMQQLNVCHPSVSQPVKCKLINECA